MRKHYGKDELCKMMKGMSVRNQFKYTKAFSVMAVYSCTEIISNPNIYEFEIEEIGMYIEPVRKLYDQCSDSDEFRETIFNELKDFGIDVTYRPYDEKDNPFKKGSALQKIQEKSYDILNVIYKQLTAYLLCHYKVLKDLGYSYETLYETREKMLSYVEQYDNSSMFNICYNYLKDEGIEIELPKKQGA